MAVSIRRATVEDVPLLAELGRATFIETWIDGFHMPYAPDDLESFLEKAYGTHELETALAVPSAAFWVAELDGRAVGFANAGSNALPHPEASPTHGELKRLYVRAAHQGRAIGRALLETTLSWLEATFPGPLWLGVWSGNERAQRLYRRYGFDRVGQYEFPVGRVRDHELIFRRPG